MMAVQVQGKEKRIARWERKRLRGVQEKRVAQRLKDAKRRRKQECGPEAIRNLIPRKRLTTMMDHAIYELWDATHRTKILRSMKTIHGDGARLDNAFVYGLAQLAQHHAKWIRRPAQWETHSYNVNRQFASLARHLLLKYDAPACLNQAWFERQRKIAHGHQMWYIRVGNGANLRHMSNLPLKLSRRAAAFIYDAPAGLSVNQSLRWAQLKAVGADNALITALLASPMGVNFERDDFWLTMVQFFVNHPSINPARVGPVVDYIHHQRHVDAPGHLEDGRVVHPGPPRPNFTMAGRTPESLLRQVDQWHRALGAMARHQRLVRWLPSGIKELDRIEGKGEKAKLYCIRELCDSHALAIEGARMRHCVASYVLSCSNRRCAIFTMSVLMGKEVKWLLTIEVNLHSRKIVQARSKRNALASGDAERVMRIWAQEAGLEVADWL